MQEICASFLRLIKENNTDERLIIPLYKTLDYLFESEEFIKWKAGIPTFSHDLFTFISNDIVNSKSISKLLSLPGLMVSLFTYVGKDLRKNSFLMMTKLLTHKYLK